jgi:uncharacterized protein
LLAQSFPNCPALYSPSVRPQPRDFVGLRHLRDKLGDRFKAGVVLYTGTRTLGFGERLAAVPLFGLWV